jgi:hypothetical protein
MVPSAVARYVIVKFLKNENVKSDEITMKLSAHFDDKTLLRIHVLTGVRDLKKAGQRLKTCDDCTF